MFFPAILLTILLVYSNGLSYSSLVEKEWENYKLKYNKMYANNDEEQFRMKTFMENMHTILEHNNLYNLGVSSYKMGMNQFGDLTEEEFYRYYTMSKDSLIDDDNDDLLQTNVPTYDFSTHHYSNKPLPKHVDWRKLGAVTRVKNQGLNCGSCYAFSALGGLEAQNFKKTGKLVSLSEQNIIDCTYKRKKYFNSGCLGGRVDNTFKYVIINGGVDTEASYPYKEYYSKRCYYTTNNIGATMTKYVNIPVGNETALQEAVAFIGPVSVMIDKLDNMRFYAGGIYDDPTCSSTKYTHGMLVIGYGTYEKLDYWLVKNSYGQGWGEEGYVLMRRNKKNQCAIATAALYPVV